MNIIEVKTYDFKTNLSSYIADLHAGRADKIVVKNRDVASFEVVLPQNKPEKKFSWGIWDGLVSPEDAAKAFDPEFEAELAEEWYKD